jgi:hypothetical protein
MSRPGARRAQLPVMGAQQEDAALRVVAPEPPPDAPRVGIVTLGCDKNTVDTERLLARLAHAVARLVNGAEDVDIVVINTCGFIDVAKEESVDAIVDAVQLKDDGSVRAVVAMGCLVQRNKSELQQELPETAPTRSPAIATHCRGHSNLRSLGTSAGARWDRRSDRSQKRCSM